MSAGTANAAKIAIIAITTSNSISVNAEGLFAFIVIWVVFCGFVLRVFLRGFGFQVVLRFGGSLIEERLIVGFPDKVNDYFLLFLEVGEPRMTRML